MKNKKQLLHATLFTVLIAFSGDAYSQTLNWAAAMGGGFSQYPLCLTLDLSGNVYTTGVFQTNTDFDPGPGTYILNGHGNYDIYISKLDSSGNFLWAKSMGAWANDIANSIRVDALGNSYTTGVFNDTVDFDPGPGIFNLIADSINDVFIVKLDPAGNFLWAKSMGGPDHDVAEAMDVDAAGNVYTTGAFEDTADFDPGPGTFNLTAAGSADIFISKLDASGNFAWAKSIGALGAEISRDMKLDTQGNIYVIGSFANTVDFDPGPGTYNLTAAGTSTVDIFILKLDTAADFLWAKSISGIDVQESYCLTLDPSGNIYTTGLFQGTTDFDPGTGIFNITSTGLYDIFISKLDSAGGFLWADAFHGTSFNPNRGNALAIDQANNVYVAGQFSGPMDFDPGPATFNLTSFGGLDFFISKLDATGNLIWVEQFGNSGLNNCYDLFYDAQSNLYVTGIFQDTLDFDPGPGIFNLNSVLPGNRDIYIMKLGDPLTGIQSVIAKSQSSFLVYPNPATEIITVKCNQCRVKKEQITINDLYGRTVFESVIYNPQTAFNIDVSSLPPGIYLIKAGPEVSKFVTE